MGNDTGKSGGDRYPFGAQERLHLIYERLAEMTRSEVAAMIVIAEHANSQTGETFVSQSTIAKRGGMTTRSATRTTAKLVQDGIITIEPRSGRTSIIKMLKPPTPVSGVDMGVGPTYASPTPDANDAPPPTPVSDEPLSYPVTITGEERNASQPPAQKGEASGEKRGRDQYPALWEVFPRDKVKQTEQYLSHLIEDDVLTLNEALAAVDRFRRYCNARGGKVSTTAMKFFQDEKWRDAWQVFDRKKNPGSKKIEKTITANADGHVADVVARFRSKLNDIKVHITGLTERKTALQRLRREIDEAEDRHIWGPEGEPPKPETARKLAYCEQCFDAWYNEIGTQCSSGSSLRSLWDEVDDELAMRG
ncbi:MAG: hypothetical protein HGB01_04645 [Chlorobiaceae bacterium]|nr:hypothetical protein [Chlorobiaceae bacterium]